MLTPIGAAICHSWVTVENCFITADVVSAPRERRNVISPAREGRPGRWHIHTRTCRALTLLKRRLVCCRLSILRRGVVPSDKVTVKTCEDAADAHFAASVFNVVLYRVLIATAIVIDH